MPPDDTSNGIDSTMMMTNTDQDSDTSDPQSRSVTTTKGIIHIATIIIIVIQRKFMFTV